MAYPLAVVESDTARVSVMPVIESDTESDGSVCPASRRK